MSKSHSGKTLTEEHKKNIGKANEGENNDMYGLYGEDHPAYGNSGGYQNLIEVDKTGHTVRSSWEVEIDLMLYNSEFDYGYEEVTFDLDDKTYTPDFIVGDMAIEVKGYARKRAIEKANTFREKYPEITYIIVGNRTATDKTIRIPCDIHITWEKKRGLLRFLRGKE